MKVHELIEELKKFNPESLISLELINQSDGAITTTTFWGASNLSVRHSRTDELYRSVVLVHRDDGGWE